MAAKAKTSSEPGRSPLRWLFWPFRFLFFVSAWGFIALVALAFTPLPWRAYNALGNGGQKLANGPDYIVILGGSGIPSESGLMRTFYGAEAARMFPKARVVIACPGDAAKTNSTVGLMREELVMRGIARQRILFEDRGRHTHEQAVNCYKMLHAAEHQPAVLLVTSPDHVKRSLMSFTKAGFTNISGTAAHALSVDVDLKFKSEDLKSPAVPDVGQSLMIRYRFWDSLRYEAYVVREWFALAYYQAQGWI